MTAQDGPRIDPDYFRQGKPTNRTFCEPFPRPSIGGGLTPAASGVEITSAIVLQAGDIAANVTFVVSSQAAVTPTAGYVCLRDSTGALITQSADFGSTARAAHTAYTVALTAPYTATAAGLYYVGISFTAGTVPTLLGVATQIIGYSALGIGAAVLSQTHGSAVGGVAPATVATPVTTTRLVYMVVT